MTHPDHNDRNDDQNNSANETPAWGSPGGQEAPRGPAHEEGPSFRQQENPSGQAGGEPGHATGASSPTPGKRFFDAIRRTGVVRPDGGRWVAGVCAGLARRWGMNPMLVRALFVLVSLLSGFGLALYGILWLLLPHPDGRIHAEQVLGGVVTGGFIGAAILTLLGGPLGGGWDDGGPPWHHHHGPGLVPLVLLGLLIWWLVRRRRAGHAHHG